MNIDKRREFEVQRYVKEYAKTESYGMHETYRFHDAMKDIDAAVEAGCKTHLDIGCGRGEMVKYAIGKGLRSTGMDPALGPIFARVDQMKDAFVTDEFDLVTCYDVIEHLLPGDDVICLIQAARLATKRIAITIEPSTAGGRDEHGFFHINVRPAKEWDGIVRLAWKGWTVTHDNKRTWWAER